MRYLKRLSKPDKLVEKEQEWLDTFLKSGNKRPNSGQYGHKEVRAKLDAMSAQKCFYCEQKLKGKPKEVDHFIEVADLSGKNLAFAWENLYLACHNCNGKMPHKDIAVTDALNPCLDFDAEIEKHLAFDDETIVSANNSVKGDLTIRKYRLDSDTLDLLRSKMLTNFYKTLAEIEATKNIEGRKEFTQNEKNILRHFEQANQPFSLMFRLLLAKYNL